MTEKKSIAGNSKKSAPHLKAHQFKKGQSGNPSGRPKKKVITELYEELLADPAFVNDVRKSVRNMIKSGRMVGQLLLKEMAERTEGKITQPIEGSLEVNLSLSSRMEKARERSAGS